MDFYGAAVIQAFCFGPLVIGLYLSMKIFRIPDITADGGYTLGAVITAVSLQQNLPIPVMLLLVVAGGGLAGYATALIHTRLRIHPLLAGILVMTALYSVNLTLMGRSNIPIMQLKNLFTWLPAFAAPDLHTLFMLCLLLLLVGSAMSYLLRSDFGLAMRATGDQESMIRALGVNTNRMKIFGLAIANGLIALSGSLVAQFQGFSDINMGIGIVIGGLGSVIIGEALITVLRVRGISVSLLIVVAGAVVFQLVLAATLAIGVDANLLKLTTALFVLLIVALAGRAGYRYTQEG